MNIQPSNLVFLGGIAIYLAIRVTFQRRGASEIKAISKSTSRDLLLVILVGTAQGALPLIFMFSPWLDWANYVLPPGTIWIGAAVMAGALWLFFRSHADLGNHWSVTLELNRNHRLITQGVYRLIRHPMYASFFMLGIGQAFLLSNWVAGWAALVAVTLLYVVRTPHEEKMMLECFGDEYREYMRRTGGIVPRIARAQDA